jgi:glucose/arabinose dehydrogenase
MTIRRILAPRPARNAVCSIAPFGSIAMTRFSLPLATVALALPLACAAQRYDVQTVAQGLEVPWGMAFAPDGRMFVTERPGRVRVIENGRLREQPLAVLPDVKAQGEAGLMAIALHPRFADNRWLYLSYVYEDDGLRLRVARWREREGTLDERHVVIDGIPAARFHAGSAVAFGPDGKLFITTGDAGRPELAQQLDSLAGKILRLNDDGSVPDDNPFAGRAGARPEIWSLGHRNPQGIAWRDDATLFEVEHGPSGGDGPRGGDEINLIRKGGNYGWPRSHHCEGGLGIQPLRCFTPPVAPARAAFWRDALWFGALRGRALLRASVDGERVTGVQRLFEDTYGRIRAVAVGPDGALYFSTSNHDGRGNAAPADDRIFRLVPQ